MSIVAMLALAEDRDRRHAAALEVVIEKAGRIERLADALAGEAGMSDEGRRHVEALKTEARDVLEAAQRAMQTRSGGAH